MNEEYKNWQDEYGMLNPRKGIRTENGILFSLEYMLLLNEPQDTYLKFVTIRGSLYSGVPGLYNQTPFHMGADHGDTGEEPISHDNLTAILGGSYYHGSKDIIKLTWDYIKQHLFTYDSRTPNKISFSRILHPRDIIYYGALAGNILCRTLLFLTCISNIVSCAKKPQETSGKLLAFVRCKCFHDSFLMKLCHKINTWQINKQYKNGWAGVFDIYHGVEGNPIRNKAREIYGEA